MIIKNVTDRATPKVAGFGRVWIEPGKQKEIPDETAYVDEVDDYGKPTGKRIVLPALTRMKDMGMIEIIETVKKAGETNADGTDKKAEAAAKRAAARAANKADGEAAAE